MASVFYSSDGNTVNTYYGGYWEPYQGSAQGCRVVDTPQAQQSVPSNNVGMDADVTLSDMEMDEEDILLPSSPGRPPVDLPVIAASTPQGCWISAVGLQSLVSHFILYFPNVYPTISDAIFGHTLLDTNPMEKDSYELVKTPTSNLMLAKLKYKVKADGWASWKKAFCMFMEIYCVKYPTKCMQLLQYSGILDNLSYKFPFEQVYNYDKEFRTGLRWDPFKPWHMIDNQLWSMWLHGIHTLPIQANHTQYNFKLQQTTRPAAK